MNNFGQIYEDQMHALGFDRPKEEILRQAGIKLAYGAGMLIAGEYIAPLFAVFVLTTGTTLDGEPASLRDVLGAGVDLAGFTFNTPHDIRLRQAIARKTQRLRDILRFEEEIAHTVGLTRLTGEERRHARAVQRMERYYNEQVFRIVKSKLPNETKVALYQALVRVADSRAAEILRNKLIALPPGTYNRDVGFIAHWQKQLENIAFNEGQVANRLREKVERGRYRWTIEAGVQQGRYEEFIEYVIPNTGGKRIDHALVRIAPGEKFIRVNDLTSRLSPDHLQKGKDYLKFIRAEVKGARRLPGSYCEYYWSERDGRFVQQLVPLP